MANNHPRLELVGRLGPEEIIRRRREKGKPNPPEKVIETKPDLTLLRRQAILAQGELGLLRDIAVKIGCRLDAPIRLGATASFLEDINMGVEINLSAIPSQLGLEDAQRRFRLLRENIVTIILRQLDSNGRVSNTAKKDIISCASRGDVDIKDNVNCLRGVLRELTEKAA